VGFEPTNGGFADLSLGPLGYRAKPVDYNKAFGVSLAASRCRERPPQLACRGRAGLSPSCFVAVRLSAARPAGCCYLFTGATGVIFASRKNRADSSGGVGLM
jgi:hypothetical protein